MTYFLNGVKKIHRQFESNIFPIQTINNYIIEWTHISNLNHKWEDKLDYKILKKAFVKLCYLI